MRRAAEPERAVADGLTRHHHPRGQHMAFVVVATWTAKQGEEDRILDVIQKMTPLSRAEKKNLFYQAQVSPEEPRSFLLYEQYTDEQGYEDHKATEHFQEYVFGYAVDYLESREVRTFHTIDA
jgi:quinol monooxygenase YgiN